MKRYIKIDSNHRIVDIFGEHLKSKFDGTEIYLDESNSFADVWINGKCISNEYGMPLFIYTNGIITEIDNAVDILQKKKKEKKDEIKENFLLDFEQDHFFSEALQLEVDLRRYAEANDLQNVQGMIDEYANLPLERKRYIGYTETTPYPVSLEQLRALKSEMIMRTSARYFKKKSLLIQITQATTLAQVNIITW